MILARASRRGAAPQRQGTPDRRPATQITAALPPRGYKAPRSRRGASGSASAAVIADAEPGRK